MEHLATFPEDKRPVNGQEKTLRMLVVSWGKAKPIMWPTQREYDARKRMRNERLAKYRANDESTRYAWGVYCCFHIVRIIQKYSCKYTIKIAENNTKRHE